MKKALFFLILFIILSAMLIWSLNALEIINFKASVVNLLNRIPFVQQYMITKADIEAEKTKNKKFSAEIQQKDEKIASLEGEIEELKKNLKETELALEAEKKRNEKLSSDQETKEEKLNKLTEIYRRMEAPAAASVIQQLDREFAAEVLANLKEEQAAAILQELPEGLAAELSKIIGSE
ncbi:MotE family protein [Halanaerobium sp. MA284_MarDTE_T2]|uniref:MotE family protein n=1 Tax=Halanaerobium sp. MA284_MarDTE_T2 TaxID=2183913 RepID=UPI000DF14716|nr:magnesium transporter MgtE [Halanaerobium sp. MA284_MarDTE_T2]RCW47690.1 MgtE-like protein [Halanaerobium sp. MA284_MarDTE_T2]